MSLEGGGRCEKHHRVPQKWRCRVGAARPKDRFLWCGPISLLLSLQDRDFLCKFVDEMVCRQWPVRALICLFSPALEET